MDKVMKPCRKCGTVYEPTPSQRKKWGYTCKPCENRYQAAWREKRRAAGLPASGSTTWDAEKRQAWQKAYYARPDVRARRAEAMRRYQHDPKLRVKHEARWKVRRALETGALVRQPCACGNPKSQAHHHDYSKPLDVHWLCAKCHREEHAKAAQSSRGS